MMDLSYLTVDQREPVWESARRLNAKVAKRFSYYFEEKNCELQALRFGSCSLQPIACRHFLKLAAIGLQLKNNILSLKLNSLLAFPFSFFNAICDFERAAICHGFVMMRHIESYYRNDSFRVVGLVNGEF